MTKGKIKRSIATILTVTVISLSCISMGAEENSNTPPTPTPAPTCDDPKWDSGIIRSLDFKLPKEDTL